MKTLFIIRGVSGSGKSTRAKAIAQEHNTAVICEADQFMYENGVYAFHPSKLKHAHASCLAKATNGMANGIEAVIVANTFTKHWEYASYVDEALNHGYAVVIETMTGRYENVHNVPAQVVQMQLDRFEA